MTKKQDEFEGQGGSYVVGPDGVRTLVERTAGDGHRAPAEKSGERVPPLPVNIEASPSIRRK